MKKGANCLNYFTVCRFYPCCNNYNKKKNPAAPNCYKTEIESKSTFLKQTGFVCAKTFYQNESVHQSQLEFITPYIYLP